jgi:hypothetical protein
MTVRDEGYEPVWRDGRPRRVPPAERAVGAEPEVPVPPQREAGARAATAPTPRAVGATAKGGPAAVSLAER